MVTSSLPLLRDSDHINWNQLKSARDRDTPIPIAYTKLILSCLSFAAERTYHTTGSTWVFINNCCCCSTPPANWVTSLFESTDDSTSHGSTYYDSMEWCDTREPSTIQYMGNFKIIGKRITGQVVNKKLIKERNKMTENCHFVFKLLQQIFFILLLLWLWSWFF